MGRQAHRGRRDVERYAEEEESELFPQIRSASDADVLEALADRLEARKAELGAPVLADKQDMTTEQLRELAKEQEIPGRSSMDHDELAATMVRADQRCLVLPSGSADRCDVPGVATR